MRTCSLFIGLVVLGCVSAIVMTRVHSARAPHGPTAPPRWVKVDNVWFEHGRQLPAPTPVKSEPAAPGALPPLKVPETVPIKALPPAEVVDQKDGQAIVWLVTGSFQTTPEEARQSALALAQAEVLMYFRNQNTPLEWVPTTSYLSTRLAKNSRTEENDFGDSIGKMHRTILEVRLTPEAQAEIYRSDREFRAQGRMAWLARMVAALVAILAAVAGYFRIDEATKGYYTTWLRVGAGFIGTTALIVMLA